MLRSFSIRRTPDSQWTSRQSSTRPWLNAESGGFFSDFAGWAGARWDPVVVEIPTTVDNEMIEVVLHEWDRTVVDHPAYEGAVLVENNVAVPEYPRPGALIDRPPAFAAIASSLHTLERLPVALPLTDLEPTVTNHQVDDAVARANDLIGEPVMLWREGFDGSSDVHLGGARVGAADRGDRQLAGHHRG